MTTDELRALLREQDESIIWLCRYVSDWGNICLAEGRDNAPSIIDLHKRYSAAIASDFAVVPREPRDQNK